MRRGLISHPRELEGLFAERIRKRQNIAQFLGGPFPSPVLARSERGSLYHIPLKQCCIDSTVRTLCTLAQDGNSRPLVFVGSYAAEGESSPTSWQPSCSPKVSAFNFVIAGADISKSEPESGPYLCQTSASFHADQTTLLTQSPPKSLAKRTYTAVHREKIVFGIDYGSHLAKLAVYDRHTARPSVLRNPEDGNVPYWLTAVAYDRRSSKLVSGKRAKEIVRAFFEEPLSKRFRVLEWLILRTQIRRERWPLSI